jgi:hypothetical protein
MEKKYWLCNSRERCKTPRNRHQRGMALLHLLHLALEAGTPPTTELSGLRQLLKLWRPLAAFAALMLVLAACTKAEEPVAVAEAYIEARNNYDVQLARELVSGDFRTSEYPDGFGDITGMELAFEGHKAYGFHYSDVDCTLSGETSEGVVVACDYLWTTELHRIGDHPPTSERLTFIIDDGQIQRITRSSSAVLIWWSPFYDRFLLSEHREFRDVVSKSLLLDPEAVRELVERLPEYFDLYEEWIDSQRE